MALHTKKQFAKLCGLSTSNVTTYISRHQIFLTNDFIDDTIPANKDFLEKRKAQNQISKKEQLMISHKLLLEFEDFIEDLDAYNHKFEQDLVKLIQSAEKLGFSVAPTILIKSLVAEKIIQSYESFFQKEIEIISEYEEQIKSSQISFLTEKYTSQCRTCITDLFENIDSTIAEIIEDHTKNEKENGSTK